MSGLNLKARWSKGRWFLLDLSFFLDDILEAI